MPTMPNNDSDRIEGDSRRMSVIRTATKALRPHVCAGTATRSRSKPFSEGSGR
jgi:hypothetical protein